MVRSQTRKGYGVPTAKKISHWISDSIKNATITQVKQTKAISGRSLLEHMREWHLLIYLCGDTCYWYICGDNKWEQQNFYDLLSANRLHFHIGKKERSLVEPETSLG